MSNFRFITQKSINQEEYETLMKEEWKDKSLSSERNLNFNWYEEQIKNAIYDVYPNIVKLGGVYSLDTKDSDELSARTVFSPDHILAIKWAIAWYIREVRYSTRLNYEKLQEISTKHGEISNTFGTFSYESLKEMLPRQSRVKINSLNLGLMIYDNSFRNDGGNKLKTKLETELR